MAQTPLSSPTDSEPKQNNLGARLLAAGAFSTVGAKLGTFGYIADANAILGSKLTFGEKIRGIFNGTLIPKIFTHAEQEMAQGKIKGFLKIQKYALITTGFGMAAGGIIGWVRGGLIADWKDIIKHPWRSTKIILGMEDPPALPAAIEKSAAPSAPSHPKHTPPDCDEKWVEYVQAQQAQPERTR